MIITPVRHWVRVIGEANSWTERKKLLQLLIEDVTLTRQETDILVQIRRHTNHLDTYTVSLPARNRYPVSKVMVERIRLLSQTQTDDQTADSLNEDNPYPTQTKLFTAQIVKGIRRRYGISKRSSNSNQR